MYITKGLSAVVFFLLLALPAYATEVYVQDEKTAFVESFLNRLVKDTHFEGIQNDDVFSLARIAPQVFNAVLAKRFGLVLANIPEERIQKLHLLAIRFHDDRALMVYMKDKGFAVPSAVVLGFEEDIQTYVAFLNAYGSLYTFLHAPEVVPQHMVNQLLTRSFERRIALLTSVSQSLSY